MAEGCYFTEDTLAELGIMSTGWGISSPSMVTATGVPSASTLTFGGVVVCPVRARGRSGESRWAPRVHTVRGALDLGGQRLNGLERLRLVSGAPLLLIAGGKDLCIPTEHTTRAHDASPGSRLELFPSAGHFPHRDQPLRFADIVLDFLATTTASHTDLTDVRHRLRGTPDPAAATAA